MNDQRTEDQAVGLRKARVNTPETEMEQLLKERGEQNRTGRMPSLCLALHVRLTPWGPRRLESAGLSCGLK